MQVSETHDHVNHAIIGGQASIEMGISTSAEFFNILSSTLYHDQMLAMVREVMCNAWDAHIENGIKDTPICITVTSEHFIVTDSGRGIHQEDMGPIYGVYGNSTKKNDGNQTGGFGLGCKAPFAYTDHFEVTSCHEGIKTIYRISKAAVQSGGKPAIIPIASFPTTESGLTVKIDLKDSVDRHRILSLVQRIGFNGEMLIKLNDVTQRRLGFDDKVHTYHVYKGVQLLETQSTICVRYGNVVYPVESCKELKNLESEISTFLGKIGGSKNGNEPIYHILFQAPAHSLSVTPSRESLSMQEHTIKTLRGLFEGFLAEVRTTFETECNEFAQRVIEEAVAKKSYQDLLARQHRLPHSIATKNLPMLVDFKAMAEQYMTSTYPKDLSFRKADWKCRIMLMSGNGLIDRGMAQTWLREIDTVATFGDEYYYKGDGREANSWLARRIIAPLLGKLTLDPNMDPDKLYVIDSGDMNARAQRNNGTHILAKNAHPVHLYHTASYLRKIVVLARRRHEIESRCLEHEMFKKYGTTTGFLLYHVGMKASDADNARAFWAKSGMNVVDMIDRQDWEEDTTVLSTSNYSRRVSKPRNKGLVTVSSLLTSTSRIDTSLRESSTATRSENPEFIVRVYNGTRYSDKNLLGSFDSDTSQIIAKLYGDRGVVSANETQYTNYVTKKGVLTLRQFIAKEVVTYFRANLPEIKQYWAGNYDRTKDSKGSLPYMSYDQKQILKAICKIQELATHYKVSNPVSATTLNYILLYDRLLTASLTEFPDLEALKAEIDLISLNADHDALIKKITNNNPMLGLLGNDRVGRVYADVKTNPQRAATFVQLITTILEN